MCLNDFSIGTLAVAAVLYIGSVVCDFIVHDPLCELTQGAIGGSSFAIALQGFALVAVFIYWNSITEDETRDSLFLFKN